MRVLILCDPPQTLAVETDTMDTVTGRRARDRKRRTQRCAATIAMAAALAPGLGCGGDSSTPANDASAEKAATIAAGGPPPAELLGSYSASLTKADTAGSKAPELQNQYRWRMKITRDGGVDDAPTLTIIKPPSDVLESSTLSVAGTTLKLTGQECAQRSGGYKLVTSSYTWHLDGKTLRLTTQTPGCPDKVAETILTSEVWTRSHERNTRP